MATRKRTAKPVETCSRYAHQWNQTLCSKCGEETPAAVRQRRYNAMMARLYADAGASVRTVPEPPDYSTPAAVTARCLEGGTRDAWYLEIRRLCRTSRVYGQFKATFAKRGDAMALPFSIETPRARSAVAA